MSLQSMLRAGVAGVFLIGVAATTPTDAYPFGMEAACNSSGCHTNIATALPTVTIAPAQTWVAIQGSNYVNVTVTVTRGSGSTASHAGFWLWTDRGTLSSTDAGITASGTDATHNTPKAGSPASFVVRLTPPGDLSTGNSATLGAWGNSVLVDSLPAAIPDRPNQASGVTVSLCLDADSDGYYSTASGTNCPGTRDCNDNSFAIKPSATEICDNVDNNCSASTDEGCDNDGDEYCDSAMTMTAARTCTSDNTSGAGSDCNDTLSAIRPNATEICDNINNNCTGGTDEGCDNDGDEYCDSSMTMTAARTCTSDNTSGFGTDCNDNSPAVRPGNPNLESCANAGTDNDCDGNSAELTNNIINQAVCSTGQNGTCSAGKYTCSAGNVICSPDLTAQPESCSNTGADNDCDGTTNELGYESSLGADVFATTACTVPARLGVCASGYWVCSGGLVCQGPSSAAEQCSNLDADNDCDGDASELVAGTHAGDDCDTGLLGICRIGDYYCNGNVLSCQQTTFSTGSEICDNLDNNCNGTVDEGCDDDNDNYCDANMVVAVPAPTTCTQGGGDCLDNGCAQPTGCTTTYPGAPELCDGLDNDCDSTPDDNIASSTCGVGACVQQAASCVGGVPQSCVPLTPGTETCANFGTDDDCDGNSLELVNGSFAGNSCTVPGGVGVCAPGSLSCVGSSLTCSANVSPSAESCTNLGIDNDCDGDSAEITNGRHAGESCSTGLQGICAAGKWGCQTGAAVCIPDFNVGQVAETCTNVGVDNDCDGDNSELTNGTHTNDACSTTGLPGVCSEGRLACSSGALLCVENISVGSRVEICDGLDNDCDGTADNGVPNIECGTGICRNSVAACSGGTNNTCTPLPSATEICDNLDNDCDGTVDDGCDKDNDNYCDDNLTIEGVPGTCTFGGGDCADTAASTYPGAPEICDGADNDCDSFDDEEIAEVTCGAGICVRAASGCEDGVPADCTPGPSQTEVCNGLDDDCDDQIDNGLVAFECGVGACQSQGSSCLEASCTPLPPSAEICDDVDNDCDGSTDEVSDVPLATCGLGECAAVGSSCHLESCVPFEPLPEICDGEDNDCNGVSDEGLILAVCGVGACLRTGESCLPSTCVPGTPSPESCDGVDEDCDGVVDNGCDDDNDHFCDAGLVYVESPLCHSPGDCDDLMADSYPNAPEICDGWDNDCNGEPDDFIDAENILCGMGECLAVGSACVDGVATDCSPTEPTDESCDGADNDCNGIIDDGLEEVSCGVGECMVVVSACAGGQLGECVPLSPTTELCDGLDNDCDGDVDNAANPDDALCETGLCVAGNCVELEDGQGGASGLVDYSGYDEDDEQWLDDLGGPAEGDGPSRDDLRDGDEFALGASNDKGACGYGSTPNNSPSKAWFALLVAGAALMRRRRQHGGASPPPGKFL